jgi:hypothetical protein
MAAKPYTKEILIRKFSETLGVEKARELIDQVLLQEGLGGKNVFYKEDVLRISKAIKLKGGFVSIIANCLAVEAYRLSEEE